MFQYMVNYYTYTSILNLTLYLYLHRIDRQTKSIVTLVSIAIANLYVAFMYAWDDISYGTRHAYLIQCWWFMNAYLVLVMCNTIDDLKPTPKVLGKTNNCFSNNECCICLEKLESCYQLEECRHQFHLKCLNMWIQYKVKCPLCKTDFSI